MNTSRSADTSVDLPADVDALAEIHPYQIKFLMIRYRRNLRDNLTSDPHFRAMPATARRVMRHYIGWLNPWTGMLMIRTTNETVMEHQEISERTLQRARRPAIEAGFIIGYQPGTGRWGGTYAIARSREEAAAARELRQADDAPKWPEVPAAHLEAHERWVESERKRKERGKSTAEKAPVAPRRSTAETTADQSRQDDRDREWFERDRAERLAAESAGDSTRIAGSAAARAALSGRPRLTDTPPSPRRRKRPDAA